MSVKQEILDYVVALPDDSSLEAIVDGLSLHFSIQRAIEQLDRGEGIPHEEVMAALDRWAESVGRKRQGTTSTASRPT